MHLARFPRLHFGHFPTPLEPLTQLSTLAGGAKYLDKTRRLHRPRHWRQ
ncbi:pyridoxal phosphate-dependent deaminase [Klebsiella michiganensis]|uniref:Pyridoxal phosphate-dependent deaminase n=1 Tax=Klebsiella michiganensis TaxID=1134687 RepID=A0A7H4N0H4_9ENTR|nr:pyridoxal phosphate-dependent deaminase [Klebsiella michiganensis]